MATSIDYSQSMLAASDELREIYCEPCQRDGKTVVADGYCVDCPEYFCAQCVTSHKRHRALANHKILDKASMPLSCKQGRTVPDVCEEKCSTHADKLIEYFCETCDTIGCSACMTLDHRQCDDVKLIMDKAKDIRTGENLNKFTKRMERLEERLEDIKKKMDSNVSENNEMKSKAFEKLTNCRKQINQLFDDLEEQMKNEVVDIEERNDKNLKKASKKIQTIRRVFDRIKNKMEKTKDSDCAFFITVKKAEKIVTQIEEKLNQIVEERRIQRYRLLPSSQIQDVMKSVTEICTMITAKFEGKIDVSAENDKQKPIIFGLTTVHDHFCAVLDRNNKCVKIIDTITNTVTSSVVIYANHLWQLTSVTNEKIAVSLAGPDCIQIFPVSANGKIQSVTQTLDLSRSDITFFNMSCGKQHIFGTDGIDVYSVSMAGNTKAISERGVIVNLRGVYVNSDNDDIYVTGENGVACLTTEGNVKAVYQDKELELPWGITMDDAGYVYVCSMLTGSVWQLTSDLKKVQVIIDDGQGLYITYIKSGNKLFLSGRGTVYVFAIKNKGTKKPVSLRM